MNVNLNMIVYLKIKYDLNSENTEKTIILYFKSIEKAANAIMFHHILINNKNKEKS